MDSQPGPSKRLRLSDMDFEKCLVKWYEESGENVSDIDDCDSDYTIENSNSTESEVEPELNNEEENRSSESDECDKSDTRKLKAYYGKIGINGLQKKIESQRVNYSNEGTSWIQNTDIVEMKV